MKLRLKKYYFVNLLVLILTIGFEINAFASDGKSWLYGTWMLQHEKDNDMLDKYVFKSDGTFYQMQIVTGFKMEGTYSIKTTSIELIFIFNGEFLTLENVDFDSDKKTLYHTLPDFGISLYKKEIKQ